MPFQREPILSASPETQVQVDGWDSLAPGLVRASYTAGLPERRREPRYRTNDPVKVEIWQSPMTTAHGTILDISGSGLRLAIETRIGKGVQVKITLERTMVIFGEVRYCRSIAGTYQAGIQIRDAVYVRDDSASHVDDDTIEFYLIGRGLTATEVIKLRNHVVQCEECRARLQEKDAILNPARRRKH